jgi:hypothetical protein
VKEAKEEDGRCGRKMPEEKTEKRREEEAEDKTGGGLRTPGRAYS